MNRIFNCFYCNKEVSVKEFGSRVNRAKYCSLICKNNTIPIFRPFWKVSSMENKIKRMTNSFNEKVIKQVGCWGWKGGLLSNRGVVMFERRPLQAHRASWIINFGSIPSGLFVLHKCDNEICSNPEHLFLGSKSDNSRDMVIKGRRSHSKLSIDQVKEIKKLISNNYMQSNIAKDFKVSPSTICDIKKGRIASYY